jgi:SLT domain-containing protein
VATYSVGSASLTVVPDMSGFSARLRADLARLRPEVKVGARLEEGDLQRIKARLRGLDTTATVRINTSGAMGGVSSLNRSLKFLALGAGGVAVAPQLVSIAGAAVQAAQSLLLLPAAASAAGASLASLLVGFSGVGKAFKGYQADQESAASTSAKSAKTEIGNAAAIRSAQEGVADARRAAARTARDGAEQVAAAEKQITAARKDAARVAEQGAQQIATAERRVTDAVDAERKAEEDVARARKDAALAAEDLRSRVQHLAVSQQEAAIRVAEAEEARAQVNRVAGATDRDRLKAELDLREARLDQADLVREAGRATTELIGIEKNGIDSTDQVQSALEKQSEAQQKVVDERADLVQTQKDVAQANQDAAAHIVEAQSAAAKAQRDAAEANADASRNVTQALESLETTQAKQAAGADAAAAKTSKFSQAMAKLSPNARELVQALIAQGAAWHAVKLDVQDKLFAGLGARITQLAKVWLPALKVGLGGIAGQFNLLFKDMIGFFAQSSSVTDWSTIMANTATTVGRLRPAFTALLKIWTDLSVVGSGFLPRLATSLSNAMTTLQAFISRSRANGDLARWIEDGITTMDQFGRVVRNVGEILGGMFKAARSSGADFLGDLERVTARMAVFLRSDAGQAKLVAAFANIQNAVSALLPGLAAIGRFLADLFVNGGTLQALAGLFTAVVLAAEPFVRIMLGLTSTVLTPLINVITNVVDVFGPLIGVLVAAKLAMLAFARVSLITTVLTTVVTAVRTLALNLGALATVLTGSVGVGAAIAGTTAALGFAGLALGIAVAGFRALNTSAEEAAGGLTKGGLAAEQMNRTLGEQDAHFQRVRDQMPGFLADMQIWIEKNILGKGSTEDANVAIAQQRAEMTGLQRAQQDVTIAQQNYQLALDRFGAGSSQAIAAHDALTAASQRQKLAQDAEADSVDLTTEKIKQQQETILGALNSNIAYQQSQIRVKEAHDATKDALIRYGAQSTQYKSAVLEEEKAITDASSAAGRYAGDQAKAKGATNSAEIATRTSKEEFIRLTDQTKGPVHDALVGVARDLKDIPVATTIHVKADGTYTLGDGTVAGSGRVTGRFSPTLNRARGGVLPGFTPGRDVHTFHGPAGTLNLSGGEAIMRPEFTKAVGAGFVNRMNATAANRGTAGVRQALGVRGFAAGGIYDGGRMVDMVTPDMTNDTYSAIAKKTAGALNSAVASAGAGGGGGGAARWAPVVLQALAMMGQPAGLVGAVLRRMNQESGGNPTIANLWDSNARRGTPSVGLMQVIGPTYRANADPRRNVGPYVYGTSVDPLSNILASMHYALRRYGSLGAAFNRAGGYDSGGWLPPGATMAVNQTGTPEAILTGRQWDSVQALAAQGASGGGTGAVINVYAREGQNTEAIANDVVRRLDFSSRTG